MTTRSISQASADLDGTDLGNAERGNTERGVTLVELMIYAGLVVVVLVIAGGVLTSSMQASATVRSAGEATSTGQLLATSVQNGVRNASAITEVDQGTDGSQLVMVRTATSGANEGWMCQAWYYSAADKAVYTTTTNPAAAISVPVAGPKGSWTLLADGVTATDPAVHSAFQVTSYSVALDIQLATSSTAVHVSTNAYSRTDLPVSAPCF